MGVGGGVNNVRRMLRDIIEKAGDAGAAAAASRKRRTNSAAAVGPVSEQRHLHHFF